ncbi:glycosyltransferase [Actinophytocola sp.]|uniref:glycosyltransferase n=1 Tax=Actinophytocola sp. TaxID=1872138 RepID=UPI003D6C6EC3
MRVLVVHNRYRSAQPSGEDRVVDQELALLREAGHRADLFERRSDDISSMSLPRKAVVPVRVPWNPAARDALAARLRADRPDVVHVHNTFPLLSPSVLDACTVAGVPVVATLHNYTQVCPTGTLYRDGAQCRACVGRLPLPAVRHGCYRGSRLATVPIALNLAANRRRWSASVDRFFCISAAQRDILVESGMPADRLVVKHNFVPEPGVVRTGRAEHLLFLGRLTEEKGVRLLMSAWDRIAAGGGLGVALALAGTGPLQDEVARWARDRDDVHYHGLRDPAGCRELIARAAAVAVPSTWLETFGLVVVEAKAAGVPAVVAGHGSLAELVDDGVTGLTHRPGDAASLAESLRRIVADPERNRELGTAARADYERRFGPRAGLANLVGGYRAAIASTGHGAAAVTTST